LRAVTKNLWGTPSTNLHLQDKRNGYGDVYTVARTYQAATITRSDGDDFDSEGIELTSAKILYM